VTFFLGRLAATELEGGSLGGKFEAEIFERQLKVMMTGLFWIIATLGGLWLLLIWPIENDDAQKQDTKNAPNAQVAEIDDGAIEKSKIRCNRWRKYKEKIERNEKFISVASTAFIAAFTVLLAFATFFLWLATRELVNDAKDNSERQLRAYIGIYSNETTVYPFEQGGFAFIAHAELRNFGQTPAYDLTVQANAAIDVPDALPFNEEQSRAQKSAGPNIAFRDAGVQVNVGWRIPEADMIAVRDRTKNIFFWGTVRYRDVFDKHHYFTFRLINGQIAVGTTGVYVMGVHPKGDEAD
jgi:hypothetical protein